MGEVRILSFLNEIGRPYVWLALACFVLIAAYMPSPAHAYRFDDVSYLVDVETGKSCPGADCKEVLERSAKHKVEVCPGYGLARRIIPCIKATILKATNDFLIPFSDYLASTVQVCCVLAVMMWGAHMISGSDTAPLKDSMVLAMKIGFVVMFTSNFGGNSLDPSNVHNGNFGVVLDIMDEMLMIVTGYVLNASRFGLEGACKNYGEVYAVYAIWNAIDCSVETLVGGIFSPITITTGVLGFIVACLFSNTIGFTIGISILYLIYKLLYAVFKCCYIYLSAYLGIAFMVVISPLFIPTILFKTTKSYFDKWLKTFISFIIQPMILFAYLAMLLAAFDTVVFSEKNKNSIYNAIAGHNECFYVPTTVDCAKGYASWYDPFPKGYGANLGHFLLAGGFYVDKDTAGTAVTMDSKAIKASGLVPETARDMGTGGEITQQMLTYVETRRVGTMKTLGIAGSNPRFLEVDIPQKTISWEKLALANEFDESTPEKSVTSYVLQLLVSAFMALITGYIFVEMLEIIPFVGSGMAMGGGIMDTKSLTGGLGKDSLSTSGSDFTKNLKFGAGGVTGGSRL